MIMLTNSKFGFGMMRLPKDESGQIDREQVKQLVDRFMESGFTYFDTAYAYGGSEEAMKEALVMRYPRDSYTIADKLPAWSIKKEEDVQEIFNTSLNRLGVDYFDFYLLHSVEGAHYPTYEKYGYFDFVKKQKEEGKIRHIGMSYHGDAQLLERILNEHPEIEFVQLQLNYLDWENGVIQSRQNYEVARKYGKPIIVMEPIKGGTLANFPKEIESIYKEVRPEDSIASWALRFLLDKPGIMTILSGMNTLSDMEENIQTFQQFNGLSQEEQDTIETVTKKLLSVPTIPCTKCRYCVPGCPMQIEIPELFTAYNEQLKYGENRRYKTYYKEHTSNDHNLASACIQCGQCEGVCPQHLPIIEYLQKVARTFEE